MIFQKSFCRPCLGGHTFGEEFPGPVKMTLSLHCLMQAGLQSELELATAEIDRTAQRLNTLEREKERLKVTHTKLY